MMFFLLHKCVRIHHMQGGLIMDWNFDKKIFRNLKSTLEKTGNLEKTLSVIDPHFNPLKNIFVSLTIFQNFNEPELEILPKYTLKQSH